MWWRVPRWAEKEREREPMEPRPPSARGRRRARAMMAALGGMGAPVPVAPDVHELGMHAARTCMIRFYVPIYFVVGEESPGAYRFQPIWGVVDAESREHAHRTVEAVHDERMPFVTRASCGCARQCREHADCVAVEEIGLECWRRSQGGAP